MLPTKLIVTVLALNLVQQCLCSPVYTMQPAYITANIGTSGRNIRHLPCVSRRTGMNGTCMFAIDCLKANGTHLGTCIDRFYFGSCCHIDHNDIHDNVIDDAAIIHDRHPPHPSASSSPEKVSSVTLSSISTASITSSTPSKITTSISSSSRKPISTTVSLPSSTTSRTVSTRKPSPTTQKLTSSISTTTQKHTSKPSATTNKTKLSTTTDSYKLSTFQSVDAATTPETSTTRTRPTLKPTRPIKPITTTTSKPTTSRTRPRPTTRPTTNTTKPILTRPTTVLKPASKPSTKPTSKPSSRPTTTVRTPSKPSSTTSVRPTSVKPVKTTTSQRLTTTSKPTTPRISSTTLKLTTESRTSVTTKLTTISPPSTTTRTTSTTSTTPSTTILTTTKSPIKIPDNVLEETRPQSSSTSVISNDILMTSTKMPLIEMISGNTVTNEIESGVKPTVEKKPEVTIVTTEKTTHIPALVTWTMMNNEPTTKNPINQTENVPESEWTPITPPDGWVMLPSISTLNDTILTTSAESTISSSTTPFTTPSTTTPKTTMEPEPSSYTTSPVTPTPSVSISTSTEETANVTSVFFTEMLINETTASSLEIVPLINASTVEIMSTTMTTPGEPMVTMPSMSPVNMSDFTDVCGRRMYPEPRIVGGEKSSFGRWPWQISLRQWKTSTYLHKCGAALLNENWAITAAHCVDNVPPSDLLLRLGEHDLSTDAEPYIHQERRVQIVASHPQFDPRTFEYDLALLRFYEPVQFQPNIIPVCVPQNDETFVGRNAYVTGWGRLYEDGPLPSVLQEVSVPVINNTVCEAMYRNAGYIEHIPNIFICAGWKHGGFDSCEGDSGGPMVIQRQDKRFLLAGIISWGIGCAEPNQPGVYTRISEFKDWINQILQF